MPASDSNDLVFSRRRYEARRGEVRLHMSHFFLRYLNDIYQAFDGDLAMAIVLGEISHHNTARFFSPQKTMNAAVSALPGDPASWTGVDGCNAYSMSCATGIPRETVRRKIAELKKRGWVEAVPAQGLRITKACADHFGADYSLRFLNGLLRSSRIIEALLAEEDGSRKGKQADPPPASPRGRPPKKQALKPKIPPIAKRKSR